MGKSIAVEVWRSSRRVGGHNLKVSPGNSFLDDDPPTDFVSCKRPFLSSVLDGWPDRNLLFVSRHTDRWWLWCHAGDLFECKHQQSSPFCYGKSPSTKILKEVDGSAEGVKSRRRRGKALNRYNAIDSKMLDLSVSQVTGNTSVCLSASNCLM